MVKHTANSLLVVHTTDSLLVVRTIEVVAHHMQVVSLLDTCFTDFIGQANNP